MENHQPNRSSLTPRKAVAPFVGMAIFVMLLVFVGFVGCLFSPPKTPDGPMWWEKYASLVLLGLVALLSILLTFRFPRSGDRRRNTTTNVRVTGGTDDGVVH